METTASAHMVTCLYFIHLPYLMYYERKQKKKLSGLGSSIVFTMFFVHPFRKLHS